MRKNCKLFHVHTKDTICRHRESKVNNSVPGPSFWGDFISVIKESNFGI